jgi:hypothetical protein
MRARRTYWVRLMYFALGLPIRYELAGAGERVLPALRDEIMARGKEREQAFWGSLVRLKWRDVDESSFDVWIGWRGMGVRGRLARRRDADAVVIRMRGGVIEWGLLLGAVAILIGLIDPAAIVGWLTLLVLGGAVTAEVAGVVLGEFERALARATGLANGSFADD